MRISGVFDEGLPVPASETDDRVRKVRCVLMPDPSAVISVQVAEKNDIDICGG
jgi:hypothetical protein